MRGPDWILLGFDVGTGGLLSGLMNCGFGGDREKLSEEWGPHLNDHHLFKELEIALAFRPVANNVIPEHKPFFVYGLWLIRKANAF